MNWAKQVALLATLVGLYHCSLTAANDILRPGTGLLELPFPEPSPLSPDVMIKECTEALSKVPKGDESLATALRERRADAYMLDGKLDLAEADYSYILVRRPKDKVVLWKRALLLSRQKSPASAEKEFRTLSREHPNFGKAYLGLALVRLLQDAPKEAIEHSNRAIALGEESAWIYYTRAFAYYGLGKFSEALADIDRSIAIEPANGFAPADACYTLRGDLLLELNEPSKAISTYLLARKLAPQSFPAAYGLWSAYARLNRVNVCVRLAEEMSNTFKAEPKAHLALAGSLLAIKQSRRAMKSARRALELDPKEPVAYRALGLAFHDLNQYEAARLNYDAALRLAPRDRRALFSKALLLATCPDPKFRDGKEARLIATDLCERTKHTDPDALSLLGMAQAECGNFPEAATAIRQALALPALKDGELRPFLSELLEAFQRKRPLRLIGGKNLPTPLRP